MSKDYGIPKSAAGNRLGNQPQDTNLTSPTNFKFTIPQIPNTVYFCQSVSMPNTSAPNITYKTGKTPLKLPGGEITHGDLSFTFIVNEDLSNYNELRNWFTRMLAFKDFDNLLPTKDWMSEQGQLIMLSNKKTPVLRFTFRGLFPVTLTQIEFDNTDTESKATVATATMAFTYYTMERF
jgi:hypothetical protein